MLQQRHTWAEIEELNPDVIEKMYRDLVSHFISEEMQHYQQCQEQEIKEQEANH